MKFQDKEHEQRYINLLNKMKKHDCYHRSAAYLMALADWSLTMFLTLRKAVSNITASIRDGRQHLRLWQQD